MSLRFLARSAAFLAAATTVAGCSHVVGSEPDTGPTQPTTAPAAESPLARSHRVTAITCSPARRQEALAQGSGAFCAPFDSIPAVTHPRFLASVHAKLPRNEPVVALELVGAARAYPVRYLVYHEIVNDVVDGHPVVVTFCPLCDSAAAHSRRVGSRILTFGVSGQLEYLNLVMFDRQTLSRWQQITGEAVGGELEGRRLAPLPRSSCRSGSDERSTPPGSSCARRSQRSTVRSPPSSASGRRRRSRASGSRACPRAGRRRSGRRGSIAGASTSGLWTAASSRRERAPSSTSSARSLGLARRAKA